MNRYKDIIDKLLKYASTDTDIQSVILIGSSCRKVVPADNYSDLDLIIVTRNVDIWYSNEYPQLLGNVSISFIEPTLGNGKERRCIYDNDLDVDMIIFTPKQFEMALKDGVAEWVMNRGYEVLYDSYPFKDLIEQYVHLNISHPSMSFEEFDNRINDFYFHIIWAYKKLKRKEIWSSKMCVDAYLKTHLLKMIEMYSFTLYGVDTWHDGRFVDTWAPKDILNELNDSFAHYDKEEIYIALQSTFHLFEKITIGLSKQLGYTYPFKARDCAKMYLR